VVSNTDDTIILQKAGGMALPTNLDKLVLLISIGKTEEYYPTQDTQPMEDKTYYEYNSEGDAVTVDPEFTSLGVKTENNTTYLTNVDELNEKLIPS
jgi:hypothetical protein